MCDICCQVSMSSHLRVGHLVRIGEDMKNFIKEACTCQARSVSIIEVIRCGRTVSYIGK